MLSVVLRAIAYTS